MGEELGALAAPRRAVVSLSLVAAVFVGGSASASAQSDPEVATERLSEQLAEQRRQQPDDLANVQLGRERGLVFRSDDDYLTMRLQLLAGVRAQADYQHGEEEGGGSVSVRFLRLRFYGNAGHPMLRYFIQLGMLTSPSLLDVGLAVVAHTWFGIEVGQFYQPFGLTWYPALTEFAFPEPAAVLSYWALGRDTGAQVFGGRPDGRFRYRAGVTIGDQVTLTEQAIDIRSGVGFAQLHWNPQGPLPYHEAPYALGDVPFRFSLVAGGYYGEMIRALTRLDIGNAIIDVTAPRQVRDGAGNVHLRLFSGPWTVAAEVDLGRRKELDGGEEGSATGLAAVARVSCFVWRHVLQLGVRGQFLDPDFSVRADQVSVGEVMMGVYPVGLVFSAQLRYALVHHGHGGGAWVLIPEGVTHFVTLQLNLRF